MASKIKRVMNPLNFLSGNAVSGLLICEFISLLFMISFYGVCEVIYRHQIYPAIFFTPLT